MLVTTGRKRPAFGVMHVAGNMYPAGSLVYDDFGYYTNIEDTKKCLSEEVWRPYNIGQINILLQRLGLCDAHFFFPEVQQNKKNALCDEGTRVTTYPKDSVVSEGALLYTSLKDGAVFDRNDRTSWCGGFTPSQVISFVLKQMCASSSSTLG